jgi:Nucleosome assembly protein (NAP)
VLEQAPPDIDQFIQPSDSAVLVSALKGIDVVRFEIPPNVPPEMSGSPRSVAIAFTFSPNEWFDDSVLEKKFWYRRAKDGWTGLVSEPVKINWKKGKDLTDGLTDAAVAAWEAENKVSSSNGDKLKGKVVSEAKSPTQEVLEKLAAAHSQASFFSWFGFRGRRVSAEESSEAVKEDEERRAKIRKGEKVFSDANKEPGQDPGEEDLEEEESDIVFPAGEELAIAISEDLFPGALKYFSKITRNS